MRSIYVLIAAYKADAFLTECVRSVLAQNGVNFHILIGVDGCEKTLQVAKQLRSNKVTVVWFPDNAGTYITFNSLLELVPDDAFVQCFGADDVMHSDMLRTMLVNAPCFSRYSGISMIPKKYYDMLGGFRPWRMAADTEFRDRLLKVTNIFRQLPMMYNRGIHDGQLTKSKEYGLQSEKRKEHIEFIENQRKLGIKDPKIERVIHKTNIIFK